MDKHKLREPLRELNACGLPEALEVMGERWSFMILRAAFNGVRHFDQSWEAVADYPGTFADKMDLVQSVDEYVFGYVLHARNDLREHHHDDAMRDYVYALLGTGDYPTLAGLAEEHGFDELWRQMDSHGRDPRRFDRNLSRLLDGFSARTR